MDCKRAGPDRVSVAGFYRGSRFSAEGSGPSLIWNKPLSRSPIELTYNRVMY